MQVPSCLWVGRSRRREFAEIVQWLGDHARIVTVEKLTLIDHNDPPQLVILAHSRPDELSPKEVSALREAWPHARFLSILGSWCEGQPRSAWPRCDIPEIHAHQWQIANWLDELKRRTVSPEVQPAGHQSVSRTIAPLVAVYAACLDYRRALTDCLVNGGCRVVATRIETPVDIRGVEIVIWDVPRDPGRRLEEISLLRTRHAGAGLTGLLTFPRDFEVSHLRKAGLQHVISQPFRTEDLLKTISRSGSRAQSSAA